MTVNDEIDYYSWLKWPNTNEDGPLQMYFPGLQL